MRISEVKRLVDAIPTLAVVVERDGRLCHLNKWAAAFFGQAESGGHGLEVIVTEPDRMVGALVRACASSRGTCQTPVFLRYPLGKKQGVASVIRTSTEPDSKLIVIFSDEPFPVAALSGLVQNMEILRCMVEASAEAMWCIEFDEPVDITQPPAEIIRQVFENRCHWAMCNSAMARIYNLPSHIDLNEQPVERFFGRSPENEEFIGTLVDGGFTIDGVPSCDVRHDGTPIYLENTVRCHIENSMLLRMVGTVRDLTTFKQAEITLTRREGEIREILTVIPDAVIVIDRLGHLRAANPAFARIFNVRVESWLGRDLRPILDFSRHVSRLASHGEARFMVEGKMPGRAFVRCEATMAPMPNMDEDRFVVVLRPAKK